VRIGRQISATVREEPTHSEILEWLRFQTDRDLDVVQHLCEQVVAERARERQARRRRNGHPGG
jgi:hypothetical protein